MVRRGSGLLAAGLLLVTAARPAAADWLLMLDGSRLETRGPWEVRGAQVVFTLPNGTLAAVRAAAVDFEGSAQITAEARAPKPAPTPPPPRKAAVRLTDADIRHVEPPAPAPVGEAPAVAAAAAPAAASTGGADLEVMTWNAEYDADAAHTVLTGTVRNNGDTLVYNLKVVVTTLDSDGKELAKTDARVLATGVQPAGTGAFEVIYPGNLEIKGARFEISAERVALSSTSAEPAPTPTPVPSLVPVGSPSAQRLRISNWRPDPEATPGSISLIGELVNGSAEVAYDSALDVTLRGPDGKDLATAQALLGLRTLQPGETTNFRVTFPGVESYQDVAFQSRHNTRQPVTRTVPARPGRPG